MSIPVDHVVQAFDQNIVAAISGGTATTGAINRAGFNHFTLFFNARQLAQGSPTGVSLHEQVGLGLDDNGDIMWSDNFTDLTSQLAAQTFVGGVWQSTTAIVRDVSTQFVRYIVGNSDSGSAVTASFWGDT